MGRAEVGGRTWGWRDRILVPSPAARTIAIALGGFTVLARIYPASGGASTRWTGPVRPAPQALPSEGQAQDIARRETHRLHPRWTGTRPGGLSPGAPAPPPRSRPAHRAAGLRPRTSSGRAAGRGR